jgi:hypothetical protein
MSGDEATVCLLLDRGADVRAENKSGNMASYWPTDMSTGRW